MERQTLFRNRQGVLPEDFNRPQEAMRDSLDHVVKDGIIDGRGWSDFTAIKSGTAEVTIGPGRIYNGGAVHAAEIANVLNLIGELPATNKKWIAIVGFGQEIDNDVQARNFLIDATTRTTQPNQVPMQRIRYCNVSTVVGVEAPQPAKPLVDAANIIIAWAQLGPAGVLSVELAEGGRVPNTYREKLRTDELFNWRALIGPQIDSIRSDIAAIKALLGQRGDQRLLEQVVIDVARVKEALELEDGYTAYDADRFLDINESNTTHVNFLAKVEEGIRFSDDAAMETSLQIFNPINPDVAISNGFLLPKYTEVQRIKVGPFAEELAIADYPFQTHEMVQRTMSRTRIRYGEEKTVCTNNAWWKSGKYDSAQGVFTKAGDTWEVLSQTGRAGHQITRLRRFWVDTYEENYWDRIVVDHTINGQQISNTYLNGADGWLTSIGLFFTAKGATGNVDIALAEVKYGMPDVESVLNKITLDVANIQVSADATVETKIPFPATFLEAGKRYAIILTTGGNHFVGMANGTQYAQGTFFVSVDGAYQQGTANKDLMFSLYFAKFARTRTTVELQPMSLAGGITDIDILAPMLVPGSCELTFEVSIAGNWLPLDNVLSGNTVLHGLPPLLPLRAVFTGTTDVQGGINLIESRLRFSRPRTTLKHISKSYTLAAPTQSFKVVALLENYYETNHNMTCTIRANGAGGELNPATTVDEEMDPPADPRSANHKRIKRTFTWTNAQITAPMSTVVITMNGSTTSPLDTTHVGERIHLAF